MSMYNDEVEKVIDMMNNSEEDLLKLIGFEKWKESDNKGNFRPDFIGTGKYVWDSIRTLIYNKICESDTGIPKEWVQEVVGGDIREIILCLLPILITEFELNIPIAVPTVALILKNGIKKFCQIKINN